MKRLSQDEPNNRLFTIINLSVIAVAILFSIGWILNIEYCKSISTGLFYLFLALAFVQIIIRSSLLGSRLFFILLIAFSIVPSMVSLIPFAFGVTNLSFLLVGKVVSSLGILIVYSIWYLKKDEKNMLDNLKLFWVILFSIRMVASSVFKIQHWPYQEVVMHFDLIAFVPLLIAFYYSELQSLIEERKGKDSK